MVQKIFPCVTTVARKRPQSFCKKYGWQVTAKHTCTLRMWLCMKWHGAWLYGVHRTRWDGSSFTWHQPCQRCKYTLLVDSAKKAIHSCRIIICEHSESAREQRISLYKSDQQQQVLDKARHIDRRTDGQQNMMTLAYPPQLCLQGYIISHTH